MLVGGERELFGDDGAEWEEDGFFYVTGMGD